MRDRDHLWGLPRLTPEARARVRQGNICMMHAMSLSEKVNRVGGAHLLEQPADRGRVPYASVWATPQMQAMEERCGASRTYVEQSPLLLGPSQHTSQRSPLERGNAGPRQRSQFLSYQQQLTKQYFDFQEADARFLQSVVLFSKSTK